MRSELSQKNKYWVSGRRYYELKYFCLQYYDWKKEYHEMEEEERNIASGNWSEVKIHGTYHDRVAKIATMKATLSNKIRMVDEALWSLDARIQPYVYHGVTEGHSYKWQAARYDMPCSEAEYYENYRKFFKMLDELRD